MIQGRDLICTASIFGCLKDLKEKSISSKYGKYMYMFTVIFVIIN